MGERNLLGSLDVDKKCREDAVEKFTITRLGKWVLCEKMGERHCEGKDGKEKVQRYACNRQNRREVDSRHNLSVPCKEVCH